MIRLPPYPLKKLPPVGKIGTEHEVRGRIAKANDCPGSLTGADIYLAIWYLLPEGDNWLFPQRTFTADNYHAGYDQLIVGSNIKLVQGQVIARTKLDVGDLFVLKWKELVEPDKTPYIKAHHITESDFDPSDPTGYREITVKRVYRAEGSLKVVTPNQIPDWFITFTPIVLLEFFGTEVEKQLPPLTAQCHPQIE